MGLKIMVVVRWYEEKEEWGVIDAKNKTEKDLYLDGGIKKKLDFGKIQIKNDFDLGGLVVGDEGSGKSTQASNIMIYMTNNKFDPRRHIIKDHDEALKILQDTPDGGGVMFDEGYLLFYSSDAITKKQKDLTKIFSIIRQKNLFFLIVAPSFFRLSTYFAVDRTSFLIRVYTTHEKDSEGEITKIRRGFFEYWGKNSKERLYQKGKVKRSYQVVRPSMRGRFTQCSLLDEAYREIKRDTLKKAFNEALDKKKEEKQLTAQDIKNKLVEDMVLRSKDMTYKQQSELFGVSSKTIAEIRKKLGLVSDKVMMNQPITL